MTFFLPLKNIHMWKQNSSLLLCSYKQTSFKCHLRNKLLFFMSFCETPPALLLVCILTLISMDKKAHTLAQHRSFWPGVLFVQNKMQMCTASHSVATCLFSYIIVIICEHNVHQFQHLKEKYLQSFSFFILPQKSFKCLKYKNIQESGYCSKLHLLLNNNKVLIYKKHSIYYPEYCYKMKIFTIYLGGVVVV